MTNDRLQELLKVNTFYNWYINHQNDCKQEFRGFYRQDNFILEIVEENTTTTFAFL
jgi:hypothetical protein